MLRMRLSRPRDPSTEPTWSRCHLRHPGSLGHSRGLNATADTRIRRTIVEIGGRTITGIDPVARLSQALPNGNQMILEGGTLLGT